MNIEYQRQRDILEESLRDTPGVISVGITKYCGNIALAVIVDSSFKNISDNQIPAKFGNLNVIVKYLGDAKMTSL